MGRQHEPACLEQLSRLLAGRRDKSWTPTRLCLPQIKSGHIGGAARQNRATENASGGLLGA